MDTQLIQNITDTIQNQIVFVPLSMTIDNKYQAGELDQAKIEEIKQSMRDDRDNGTKGLHQVPEARLTSDGLYELAFGRHRRAAFQQLAYDDPFWSEMPIIVREFTDQQMFKTLYVENLQRREINPIEKAELYSRYMQEFNKTSAEAGEFFGVSEEVVRGTVRLTNLVPGARQALANGEINITTAREMLSMQKIVSEQTVIKTLENIKKGEDKWGNESTPEEIIESTLNHQEEVVDMWNDSREGKPRSVQGYREDGWLLSMKNFPNKMLPELTPVDLAVALGIQDDQHLIAAANTWAMFKCGQLNQTAEEIEALDIPAEIKTKVDHLLNPPACNACPFYTRVRGSHYCGMKTCHTRKMIAWKANILHSASKDLNIAIYSQADGKYKLLENHDNGDAALFTKRGPDLRLIEREKIRGYHYQNFPGVKDEIFLVAVVGETLKKMDSARKEAVSEVKQSQSVEQRKKALEEDHIHQLDWEATQYIKCLFDAFNDAALDALDSAAIGLMSDADSDEFTDRRPAEDADKETKLDFKRRIVALAMVEDAEGRHQNRWQGAPNYAEFLSSTAKKWGIKLPKSFFNMATKMDEEVKAVTTETVKKTKSQKGK